MTLIPITPGSQGPDHKGLHDLNSLISLNDYSYSTQWGNISSVYQDWSSVPIKQKVEGLLQRGDIHN